MKVAQGQLQEAINRRKTAEHNLKEAERELSGSHTRKETREMLFAALKAVRERFDDMNLSKKRELLRILVPGGPDYRVEVSETRENAIRGAIDFSQVVQPA